MLRHVRVIERFLCLTLIFFFFQAEDGIRYLVRSRGLGDVYKRQDQDVRQQVAKLIDGGRGSMRRYLERPRGAEPLGGPQQRPEPLDDNSGHA